MELRSYAWLGQTSVAASIGLCLALVVGCTPSHESASRSAPAPATPVDPPRSGKAAALAGTDSSGAHPLRAALSQFAVDDSRDAGLTAFATWLRADGRLPQRTCAEPLSLLKTSRLAGQALTAGHVQPNDILRLAERLRVGAVAGTELILAYRLAARVRDHTPGASSIDWSIFRPVPADDLRLIEVEVRCMMGVVAGPQFSDADRAAVAAFGADWASGAQARLGQPDALGRYSDEAIERASAHRVIGAIAPPRMGASLRQHHVLRASWPGRPQ